MTDLLADEKVIYLKEHEEHWTFSSTTVVYMKNILGEIEIRACDECGYEDVKCLHIKNEKNTRNLTIVCLLCGG